MIKKTLPGKKRVKSNIVQCIQASYKQYRIGRKFRVSGLQKKAAGKRKGGMSIKDSFFQQAYVHLEFLHGSISGLRFQKTQEKVQHSHFFASSVLCWHRHQF